MNPGGTQTKSSFNESLAASWQYTQLVAEVLEHHYAELLPFCADLSFTLTHATTYEDTRQATDYRANPRHRDLPLAVRVRSFSILRQYGGEFVLRDTAPRGVPTEADKVLANPQTATVYLYAFANISKTRFLQYILVDLLRLRAVWSDREDRRRLHARRISFPNGDRGLSLPVSDLRETDCLIGARMARRTYERQRDAREVLEQLAPYDRLDSDGKRKVELLLMQAAFGSEEYRRSEAA